MTDIVGTVTAYLPFEAPHEVRYEWLGGLRHRIIAEGSTDEEVLEALVVFHDRIGAEVFRVRTLVNERKNREMSAKTINECAPGCTCLERQPGYCGH